MNISTIIIILICFVIVIAILLNAIPTPKETLAQRNAAYQELDPENQTVTIKAPEIKMPEKKIVVPKGKIITGRN